MDRDRNVSPLETHLGFWLRFVSNHVSHAFALKLQQRGLSVAEWVLMREVYDAETAPSDLAARIGMTRGAVSKIIDKLVAKSLATRAGGKTDRRYQTIALTERGVLLLPALAELADLNDEEFFSHIAAEKRAELIAVMREIVLRRGLDSVPID
jgi:DNA-binding MarR family transcriptional regulator